jgi:hypothetical protein
MDERQWGEKKGGLAISVAVEKRDFRPSDHIVLNIMLKNFGTSPVSVVVRSPWADYRYVIRNGRGAELPMLMYGRQRAEAASEGRKIIRELRPGESQTDDFELNTAFDLKNPDTYTLFASRTLPSPSRPAESFTLQSNAVTVRVTE